MNSPTTDATGFPVSLPTPQPGFLDNIPQIEGFPGVSAFNSIQDSLGNVTGLGNKARGDSGLTKADERLHIVRSRAAKALYDNNGKDTYTSDRGDITRMQFLPGPGYDPVSAVKGASSNVESDVKDMLAGRFVNFFLTDISLSFNEKAQITQTFGDNEVVYYFGRQPMVMNLSGMLFDSLENDWFSKFMTMYAGVLRGTQLAKTFSLIKITFPNMVVTGSISSFSFNQNSQRDTDIPFQMQFIAKEVVPLPVPVVNGSATNNVGTLVDWKATRDGVQGYSLSMGGLGGGFMDSVNKTVGDVTGIGGAIGGALGSVKGAVGGVNGLMGGSNGPAAALTAFRTNIFTPVFGVISSITKIVKSVTGDITSIISSFTNPVNQVLRDIQSVSVQATGLALLVENSVNDIISIPVNTITNFKNTVRSLKSTAGTISRVPENISQSFKRLHSSGRIKHGAAVLSSGKARTKSKAAVLSSGAPYTPSKSNSL
jgi:hypothetical protein